MPWKIHMGKSKRENQIKIYYFLSSFIDYRSIFFIYWINMPKWVVVKGGRGVGRGEVRSYGEWATVWWRFFCYCTLNSWYDFGFVLWRKCLARIFFSGRVVLLGNIVWSFHVPFLLWMVVNDFQLAIDTCYIYHIGCSTLCLLLHIISWNFFQII